jgi:hypothetical protein
MPPGSAGFLLCLLFDPAVGGMFLQRKWALSELHGVTTQKTVLFMVTAMRTSNPRCIQLLLLFMTAV